MITANFAGVLLFSTFASAAGLQPSGPQGKTLSAVVDGDFADLDVLQL